MSVRVTVAPVCEPVTLAQARLWCRIESDMTDDDAVLTLLIQAMREYAENLTGRDFIQRTRELILSGWQQVVVDGSWIGGIELPYPPLSEVTGISYKDSNGATQTLDPTLYAVHADRDPGVILPAWQATIPAARSVIDAWRVTYISGYAPVGSPVGDTERQAGVPAALKAWMQARIATIYENREQLIAANRVEIPRGFADGMLDGLIAGGRLF